MSHHRNDLDWERLDRYVTGSGTLDELEALERWVLADPELVRVVDTMRAIGHRPTASWNAPAAWTRLHANMQQAPVRPLRVMRISGPHRMIGHGTGRGWRTIVASRIGMLAAATILLVAGSMGAWRAGGRMAAHAGRTASLPAFTRDITTRHGERASLDLADGSRVTLAPGSRLRVPATFSGVTGARELWLEGEAWFSVKHDTARPFRVMTATAVTEDIGTEFVIAAYPETHMTRVVVREGSVALRRPLPATRTGSVPLVPPTVLVAGDLAQLDVTGATTRASHVSLAPYLSWTSGTLLFDATRLGDALPQLQRWYDLDITLADSALAQRRLTGSFKDESVQRLLEVLTTALDVHVHRTGRTVVLSAAHPTQSSSAIRRTH